MGEHLVGDPIENDIHIPPSNKIVIVEGNYLALNQYPWNEICQIFDERWFIETRLEVAMNRLKRRHQREMGWKA